MIRDEILRKMSELRVACDEAEMKAHIKGMMVVSFLWGCFVLV